MKSFSVFLTEVNDGQANAGLTADLTELLASVKSVGKSGSLTIKVKVSPATNQGQEVDKITLTIDRKLELPKAASPADFFWLTDDAEPSRKHPRQRDLELEGVRTVTDPDTGEITSQPKVFKAV